MTYDWSGERTRRLRLMRVATITVLVGLIVSVPLLMVTA
ncbi:hypothetical protein GGI64_004022 [Rhizobium leguminosarum]|uniref:Uncharacterized protein n=3 Tax=Rhizobium leguminosarum TaxID=384 RepID=A0A7Z0E0U2_RHILE|nr:hypothetical protein Rleg2_3176 [Rhizobium leguminosarum bv. trifolii WSM2304]ANM12006.1 hypothetical protein AMK05_CH03657 [Rhizobium sp. N324]ANM18498.1 hypothetical protein AMK06_CH03633 [Rhizobium sp. N541]ANM24884.1 hypothetical protein AMK07_CH03631 [Rhizobium sp. N941]EJB05684.1 hypothetical protein Rleg9DRAFT_4574 [Rhizobium leguminosarum bv. trifolii WSM597]MBB3646755.1 hypothetical protein [Rhizobium sp. BK619]MBB5667418.1 hypothetical protein [Rhizobium leguminosarum]OYD05611.1